MDNKHLEIERKFLIAYPDTEFLNNLKDCNKAEITQIYVKNHIRIRRWTESGKTSYIKTVKERISELTRIETEEQITKQEFDRLLSDKEPDSEPIQKTRYSYPYLNKVIEIDIFPFWNDRAFAEVELESETEDFTLPPFIKVIKEVTCDNRYHNSSLAKHIPFDKI